MAYDGGVAGPGNITSQTGIGTYAYPAAGQPQPHAVTSLTGTFNGIVNPTFSYDLNGNMTSRAGSTISWFSNNYPATISASDATGGEEVQFVYGPDRQRWGQIYTGPSGTETTYYIGGLIDLVFTGGVANYRQYIYAGREPVAVYSRTAAGVNAMSYMLEDHQSGLSAITSNAGASDIGESFTAFGQRRNPTTWSGAPATADLNTIAGLSRQGYTFQTWLGQSMGLNHMNGRVEDAILGRFLSPDPHIPDPSNAQSYNRYSYVNNNPLTLVDPSGFEAKQCPTDGGCGGDSDSDLQEIVVTATMLLPEIVVTALNPDYASGPSAPTGCSTCNFNFAGIGPAIAPYDPRKAAATITAAGIILGSLGAIPVVLAGAPLTIPIPATAASCLLCSMGVLSDATQITADYMEITTGVEAAGAGIETGIEALEGAIESEAAPLGQTVTVTLQNGTPVTVRF